MDHEHGESHPTGEVEPCEKCRENGRDNSGDNKKLYDDGHGYCYACSTYYPGNGEHTMSVERTAKPWTPITGRFQDIPARGLTEKTCRKYGYSVVYKNGSEYHVAPAFKAKELIAQHIRQIEPKDFKWSGSPRGAEFFGQHLFKAGGKRIVITEGEVDAMSVFQVNNGWPVVSLPNGVQSAERTFRDNLEWVSSFGEIILMFDMDEPGQEAAKKVAMLLPPGKAGIASLPYKDPNECILNGASKDVANAAFEHQEVSPDEVLHVSEIVIEDIDPNSVLPYPWESLNDKLIGNKSADITLWASGTGSGKSTILRELASYHLNRGRKVGMIMLEESPQETVEDLISLNINSPIRAIRSLKLVNAIREREGMQPKEAMQADYKQEDYDAAREALNKQGLYIYDHQGRKALENMLGKVNHFATSKKCDIIILDHITALASAMMTDDKSNERLIIDKVMGELESIGERTGCRFHVVTQLKKTEKAFEEGAIISMQDLKGSGSLGHVPDTVIALERNRQAEDPVEANTTVMRILKSRMVGSEAGVAGAMYYDKISGRCKECEYTKSADGGVSTNAKPFGGI